MSILLLKQILSLFLMMACGFTLVKAGLLKGKDTKPLSVMSIYLIVPAVIIKSFQIELTEDVRNGFLLATAAAVLAHAVLLLISFLYKKVLKLDAVERSTAIYSNAGNLIIPLVTAILGDEWVIYASAFICVQQFFFWTHMQMIISGERRVNWKKLVTNVNLIAIIVGLLLMILRVRLPGILMGAVNGLAGTIGPVSMIMVGMLLAETKPREIISDRRVYLVTLLRLIVTPLLLLTVLKVSGLAASLPEGKTILYVSFMAMMTPAATTITQLSQLYDNRPAFASAANVMTTILCIATMPLLTQLYMLWI